MAHQEPPLDHAADHRHRAVSQRAAEEAEHLAEKQVDRGELPVEPADDVVEDAAELAHELGVGLLGSEKTPGTKIPMEMTSEKALIRLERMVRIFTD